MKSVLALAGASLVNLPRAAAARTIPASAFSSAGLPVLGNPAGDVTIVEFFDYQCGYCKAGFRDLRSAVAEDGNVRLIMKDWTIFGDASVYASRMVFAAAKQGAYEPALNALMATRGRLSNKTVDRVLQRKAGLDVDALRSIVATYDSAITHALDQNYDLAISLGLEGTPSFLIGNELVAGAISKTGFKRAIAKARGVNA